MAVPSTGTQRIDLVNQYMDDVFNDREDDRLAERGKAEDSLGLFHQLDGVPKRPLGDGRRVVSGERWQKPLPLRRSAWNGSFAGTFNPLNDD